MPEVLCPEDGKHVILIEHHTAGVGVRDDVELRVIPVGLKVDLSRPRTRMFPPTLLLGGFAAR